MIEFRKYTQEEIDKAGKSKDGLASLGVSWPPTSGWTERLKRGEDPNVIGDDVPQAVFQYQDERWLAKVRCDREPVKVGMVITVTRKDGTFQKKTINEIVKIGTTYALCGVQ